MTVVVEVLKTAERQDGCSSEKLLAPCVRTDFFSSQKLLAAILLKTKSITQELAANILMTISIVKLSASVSCHDRKASLKEEDTVGRDDYTLLLDRWSRKYWHVQ